MRRIVATFSVSVLIVFVGLFLWNKQPEPLKKTEESIITEVAYATSSEPVKPERRKYKDGTYKVNVSYISPGGKDDLGVSLTVSNDKIIGGEITNKGGDSESRGFQNRFIMRFVLDVIGKPFDTLKLETKSGASLTTAAFNQALTKLRVQAIN